MKRYAANLLYCSPGRIIKNGVIEVDEQTGRVVALFSLDEVGDEVSSTVFLNGILLPFRPVFSAGDEELAIFEELKKQFEQHDPSVEMVCNKKIDCWLLEGSHLLTSCRFGAVWNSKKIF